MLHAVRERPPLDRIVFARILQIAVVAGTILLVLELTTDKWLLRLLREVFHQSPPELPSVYNRAATVLAIFVWPAINAALRFWNWRLALIVLAVVLAVLFALESAAAIVACLIGIVVFLSGLRWPNTSRTIVLIGTVGTLLIMPLVPGILSDVTSNSSDKFQLPTSVHHRLQIWRFAAEAITVRPVIGWGLDSARSIPSGKRQIIIQQTPTQESRGSSKGNQKIEQPPPFIGELMPLHPHNGPLQIWLELGGIGVLLVMVGLCTLVFKLGSIASCRIQHSAALAFVCAVFTITCLSYGVWQTWWLSTIWLCSAVLVATNSADKPNRDV